MREISQLALGESGKASIFARVNSDVSGIMAMKSHVKSMKKSGHYSRRSIALLGVGRTRTDESPKAKLGKVKNLKNSRK
jgi:hypothetical protein